MTIIKKVNNGVVVDGNSTFEYAKVTADYSQEIIGMWEGVDMTGFETYGNAEARYSLHHYLHLEEDQMKESLNSKLKSFRAQVLSQKNSRAQTHSGEPYCTGPGPEYSSAGCYGT